MRRASSRSPSARARPSSRSSNWTAYSLAVEGVREPGWPGAHGRPPKPLGGGGSPGELFDQRPVLRAEEEVHVVVVAGDDQAADDIARDADTPFTNCPRRPRSHLNPLLTSEPWRCRLSRSRLR